MVISRKLQGYGRIAVVCLATGAALGLVTAPAWAGTTLDIAGASPNSVAVDYTCDPSSEVKSVKAMAGEPDAERPAEIGSQSNPTCDGGQHRVTITLAVATGETALKSGDVAQVRVALMDQSETVITGQAKVLTLE